MKADLIAVIIIGFVAVHISTTYALRYTVYNTKVTFYEAWQLCLAKGGGLASIETARQNALVLEAVKKSGSSEPWWISGTDMGLEGSWIWLSRNKPVGDIKGYVNYRHEEPNNYGSYGEHCLTMISDGIWNDEACDKQFSYVCEFYSP